MDPEPSSRRIELQTLLEDLLDSSEVHFQPPANIEMHYPSIVYSLDDEWRVYADNAIYNKIKRYLVTVITDDPDSDIPDQVSALPMCSFDRFYPADNLNHYVYNLYF